MHQHTRNINFILAFIQRNVVKEYFYNSFPAYIPLHIHYHLEELPAPTLGMLIISSLG